MVGASEPKPDEFVEVRTATLPINAHVFLAQPFEEEALGLGEISHADPYTPSQRETASEPKGLGPYRWKLSTFEPPGVGEITATLVTDVAVPPPKLIR